MDETKAENQEVSTNRLEAFSDGVFAIAITLLILQIKLPVNKTVGDATLRYQLLKLWPNYFAYILSFMLIGIYWANHHYIFKFYVKTNHFFLLLNLLFLMSISFLPFPTAIFGEFISDMERKGTSVTFYTFGLFLPSFFWYLIWAYASYGQRLTDEKLSKKFIRYLNRLYFFSALFYLSSVIISLYDPLISVIISVVITLLFMLPPKKPEYQDA